MPRRRPHLPAPVAGRVPHPADRTPASDLVAALLVVLLALPVLLLPALAQPASAAPGGPSTPAGADAEEEVPLRLEISELTPSVPRADEQVEVSGTITNESAEEWTTINVHAFHSTAPILDPATLAAAAGTANDEFLGPRVVDPGTFQTIPSLQPGESAPFTAYIPAGRLGAGDGVYWAGVHAMGQSESQLRDENTDGRARTFVPVVSGERRKVDAALLLPLRSPVKYTPAGRVASPARWAKLLGPGGRLRNLLEAGRSAGDRPVTWLLDPAVPHAAMKLAAGNPRASLEPLPGAETGPEGEETPEQDASSGADVVPLPSPSEPTATPEEGEEPETDPAQEAAAAAAEGWLELFRAEMAAHPVLALPYGDVDASALQRHVPELLALARAHATSLLDTLGITATPVLASPDGHLSPEVVSAAPPETVMLLSDRAVQDPEGRAPSTGQVLGRTFATTSSGAAAGGPGPEPAAGPIAVRQRVVSEAALRMLSGDRSPLVVAPPPSWDPATGSAVLFSSFDEDVLRLRPLAELVGDDVLAEPQQAGDGVVGDDLAPEALAYGEALVEAELPGASTRAATQRLERAQLLDRVLTRPSGLVGQVAEAVLPSVSYFARRQAGVWRKRNVRGTGWVQERLDSIRVDTPLRATLSSDHGTLGVTLVNDLDVSVEVRIAASSQGGLRIAEQDPLTLAPRSRRLLRLSATATREGTDELTLRVTDVEGTPLGASSTYPVRTSQVSGTLWVIMAVGAALLFGTIGGRLVRGNRRTRREQAEAEAAEAAGDTVAAGEAGGTGGAAADGTDAPRTVTDRTTAEQGTT